MRNNNQGSRNSRSQGRNRNTARMNYSTAGAYTTDADYDVEENNHADRNSTRSTYGYGTGSNQMAGGGFDNSSYMERRWAGISSGTTSDELMDEDDYYDNNYDSGYDDDEGYDNYEIRSTRVDFDHDYEETRGDRNSRGNPGRRERRSDRREGNIVQRIGDRIRDAWNNTWDDEDNGYDLGSGHTGDISRSSRRGYTGGSGAGSSRGYSGRGGSDYNEDYQGGSGYRGGSSSRRGHYSGGGVGYGDTGSTSGYGGGSYDEDEGFSGYGNDSSGNRNMRNASRRNNSGYDDNSGNYSRGLSGSTYDGWDEYSQDMDYETGTNRGGSGNSRGYTSRNDGNYDVDSARHDEIMRGVRGTMNRRGMTNAGRSGHLGGGQGRSRSRGRNNKY